MSKNILQEKCFHFSIQIYTLGSFLLNSKREYILSKQIIRSGTSVGANCSEAQHAESKADFKHKLAICQKEINETIYWIQLIKAVDLINDHEFPLIEQQAKEILFLLTRILKTLKSQ